MPLDLRLETDGVGAVSLACTEVVSALAEAVTKMLRAELGRPIEVIDLRIDDEDGREVGPSGAVLVVGFRLRGRDGER